ncbi:uncharacterized protein [Montipora foliosa]|uniref:uncharacterized protein n=1 Tax=Montipora foliosa TaxID=591990 RepID=UPI0035F1F94B
MGGAQSTLPPRPVGFEYFCVAVRAPDIFRVILATDYEISIIRRAIKETWRSGIQSEYAFYGGVHEFTLRGFPFAMRGSPSDAVMSRKMAARILHRLYLQGWKLIMSCDLTRTTDLTTWIFKKVPVPVDSLSSQPFLVVGLSSIDSLMILNSPAQLHQTFKDVIRKAWPPGIQNWSCNNGVLLITLNGTPWIPHSDETVSSRVILHTLINNLYLKQWDFYGNSNLKGTANTLFFVYDHSITPELTTVAHFTISLNKRDTLRLIGIPSSLVSVIRETIRTSWQRGIQAESRYFGSWEFKLYGNPWWASSTEAVDSRYLIVKLIECLQHYGWTVIASIDSSRKPSDKSSLTFRLTEPRQLQVFCVSLNENDKLRLINAPANIKRVCKDVIRTQYALGIKRIQQYGNSLEFELQGTPWSKRLDGVHGRNMMCHLFHTLECHNWKPLTSADLSAKYVHRKNSRDYPTDVDSIFFTFDDTQIQPSAPPEVPGAQAYSQPYSQPPPYNSFQWQTMPPGASSLGAPPSYEDCLRQQGP